jgi:hypothetical protein
VPATIGVSHAVCCPPLLELPGIVGSPPLLLSSYTLVESELSRLGPLLSVELPDSSDRVVLVGVVATVVFVGPPTPVVASTPGKSLPT